MKIFRTRFVARVLLASYIGSLYTPLAYATPLSIPDVPLFTSASVPPMVMLDVTKDHQLYYKAYNDYSDLDGDGAVETTYKHSFNYYGYFDPIKCYTYNTGNSRFEPAALADANRYCSGQWSGNFLNWLAMSRMDVVRKVLYGGTRSTDTASLTVLERSYLPTEAHSWAKYYNGSDIAQLTPFNDVPTAAPNGESVNTGDIYVPTTGFPATRTFSNPTGMSFAIGDQILAVRKSGGVDDAANQMEGVVTATTASTFTITVDSDGRTGNQSSKNWTITNRTTPGLSFCNTTYAPSGQNSTTTTQPPLIRVAQGNYTLWGANERWQCYWASEKNNSQSGFSGGIRSNGNRFQRSGMGASAENPPNSRGRLPDGTFGKADYYARVVACNGALIGNENCATYGTSVKPVGLLQKYGEGSNPKIKFGLMTGSYEKNVSGGVLRKNIGGMADEISTTDGTLTATVGIVRTIDKMRLYGYEYTNGTYIGGGANVDNCTYQQIGIVSDGSGAVSGGRPANEGNCASWGNPMSEIYIESLRYFAGNNANAGFLYAGGKDAALGLPLATWSDPIRPRDTLHPENDNFCSPMNVVAFNASVSSFDKDQTQSGAFSTLGAPNTVAQYTTAVGNGEGISSVLALVGDNGTTSDGVCTPKTIADLSAATGICPEAPSLKGGFLMAGAAYYAHTNRIRSSPTLQPGDNSSYKVTTYGIALATAVPKINVTVGGRPVTIQPAYRLDRSDVAVGRYGTGTIVDFRVVSQAADGSSGTYYVNWEDSNQGGDYDQDVIGILKYQVVDATRIDVSTRIISASTANPQGFGYAISGTTQDGAHFHSGIYNFSYTDPQNITIVSGATEVNASGGCNGCSDNSNNRERTARYTLSTGATVTELKDPLYYAAKYGGFVEGNVSNSLPDLQVEWDNKLTNGTIVTGGDGIPDTFFYVNNPGSLEASLDSAFTAATQATTGSAVATNSTSLRTGGVVYQARFNPSSWSGELIAYPINTSGIVSDTPLWNAGENLNESNKPAPGSRVVLTYDPSPSGGGIPFQWSSLNSTQRSQLQITGEPNSVNAQARVDWLRGSSAREGNSSNDFRARLISKLGDIVDSSPAYVAAPAGRYNGDAAFYRVYQEQDYFDFRNNNKNRTQMIYIGANDGMLHGFDASNGVERIAFIPNAVFPNLALLTTQNYQHKYFVDGTPKATDAKIRTGASSLPTWRTLLVGGLNKGGKGIYLLDVTDPASFSETNASSLALWEFTSDHDSDLGYTYGRPDIVKLNNGKWAVILGNGYNSTNGHAVLFLLFIEEGLDHQWTLTNDYVKLDTLYGSSTNVNGLSAVTPMDLDGNGTADAVYAGDIKGNLWKFDIGSADTADWKVAETAGSRIPLFVACRVSGSTCSASDRQAITSAPEVTFHPENQETQLIYFGSGKYLESNDPLSAQTQTFYGVWDNPGLAQFSTQAARGRSELLQQTITNVTATQRTTSTLAIDWTQHFGWYEDLPTSGERITAAPLLINGTLFYNTFIPSLSPCDFGGTGYLMGVNYKNGSRESFQVFDANGDGVVNSADTLLGGIVVGAALGGTTFIAPGATGDGVGVSNPTKRQDGREGGTIVETDPIARRVFLGTRISWRELLPK